MKTELYPEFEKAFGKITLTDAAKSRIISTCKAENAKLREIPKRSGLKLAAILAAAALILGGTVCAAMNGVFGGGLKSHIPENLPSDMAEYPGTVMLPPTGEIHTETDETSESDSAGISVTCDAVSGGGNVIYINLTVRGTDGNSPLTLSPGRILERAYSHDASVTFSDGTKKEIQFWKTESGSDLLRFEGLLILSDAEKSHIGEKAVLNTGHLEYDFSVSTDAKLSAPLGELLSTLEESEAVREGECLRYANGEVAYRYTLGKGDAANAAFGKLGFSSDLPEAFIDSYAIAPYGEISGGRQYDALYIGYSGAPILEADGYETKIIEYSDSRKVIAIAASGRDVTLSALSGITSLRAVEYGTELISDPLECEILLAASDGEITTVLDNVKINVGGEKILLDSLKLDAASLTLYGTTDAKTLPGLEPLMAGAKLTTSDSREIACGDKFSSGTDADGRFTMNWILSEVIDPRKVTSLELGGKSIEISESVK